MWRCYPASSGRPTQCPTLIGTTAFPLAASRRSMRTRAGLSPPAEWASTSPAACAWLSTGLITEVVDPVKARLADGLFRSVPAGLGSMGQLHLDDTAMNAMLAGGARWAVERGYGTAMDLDRIEEHGCMAVAKPEEISDRAKTRQCDEMRTLGSGNHYLEVQKGVKILDRAAATAFGLAKNDVVVNVHCGSRGLGHQIGTEFLRKMAIAAPSFGIDVPDRELA